eukprot:3283368-Amphidinium_carterae.1
MTQLSMLLICHFWAENPALQTFGSVVKCGRLAGSRGEVVAAKRQSEHAAMEVEVAELSAGAKR